MRETLVVFVEQLKAIVRVSENDIYEYIIVVFRISFIILSVNILRANTVS